MATALVIGGAECVAEDLRVALAMFTPDRVYAVNDVGAHVERLDTWCTLHPEFMDKWEAARKSRGLPRVEDVVAPPGREVGMHGEKGRITRRVSYRWSDTGSSASSGIYAAKVAIEDGFRCVLVGIPMDSRPNLHRGGAWTQHGQFVVGFNRAVPHLLGKVRSVSGETMRVLGAPTPEWLSGLVGEAGVLAGGCPVQTEKRT